jgi:hypothetical protein
MASRSVELSAHTSAETQEPSFLEDFARSCVYSGLQSPARGAAQLVDHIVGTHSSDLVTFMDPPKQAEFGSVRWHVQAVGSAIGTVMDFALLHRFTHGNADRLLESPGSRGFLDSSIGKAFAMGAAYDGICKEVPQNENFFAARLKNAAVGGATFAALTGSFRAMKQIGLSNKFLSGVASGIPSGFVNAEGQSLAHGGKAASGKEIFQSMYGFSLIGGAFSFAGKSHVEDRSKILPEAVQKTDPSVETPRSEAKFKTASAEVKLTDSLIGKRPLQDLPLANPQMKTGRAMLQPAVETLLKMESQRESGPFENRADFDRRGIQQVERTVNIYKVNTPWTHQVIIPKEFDQSLNELRILREATQFSDSKGPASEAAHGTPDRQNALTESADAAWAGLRQHPHKFQLLPEEVPALISTLPNPTYFNKVVIADGRNPTDLFHSEQAGKDFYSSAKTTPGQDTITIFPGRNGTRPEQEFKHEWSHQLEAKATELREAFEIAANLEQNGHFDRDYAKLNSSENWAVHMEALLDTNVQQFLDFVDKAPLRASILGRALKVSLDACPLEQRSPLHDQYLDRVEYIKQREPQVVSTIIETFRNGSSEVQAETAKFLAVICDDPLATLTHLAGENSKHQTAPIRALLELGPQGLESVRALFEQGQLTNPSAVAELIAASKSDSAQAVFKQAVNQRSIADRQQLALEVLRLAPEMRADALRSLEVDRSTNFQDENWLSPELLEDDSAARSFYNAYLEHSLCRDQLPKWEDDWAKFFSSLMDGSLDDNYLDGLR